MDDERSKRNFEIWADALTLEELEAALSLVEKTIEEEAREEKANPQKVKNPEEPNSELGPLADIEIAH